MQEKVLQIVSFDLPFPPKYGGAIDVFYKIKALNEIGYSIVLHCFVKEHHTVPPELTALIKKCYYYRLNQTIFSFFSSLPISIKSRNSKELLLNLKKIKGPILFESLKVTGLLEKHAFQEMFLRLHNVESAYFRGLAKSESNYFMKIIYFLEGLKFERFERKMNYYEAVFTLSKNEQIWSEKRNKNARYVPLFHGNVALKDLTPFGKYAIYSGDMRTADNKKAVEYLISVFNKVQDYDLVIAVSEGIDFVQNKIGKAKNITAVQIDNYTHLQLLLAEAHINVMVSFQASGTKLKLVNALFNSRHCLINENMVDDDSVLSLCKIASNETEFIQQISLLKLQPFTDFDRRKQLLSEVYDDLANAKEMDKIFRKLI
jgi:hypothetical protein